MAKSEYPLPNPHKPGFFSPYMLHMGENNSQGSLDPRPSYQVGTSHNPKNWGIGIWREDFARVWFRQPPMMPHIYQLSIANPLYHAFLNNLSCLQNTPPCIRALRMNWSHKNITIWEILSTKDFKNECVSLMKKTPNLFSQQSIIKLLKIPKSHTSNWFWRA